MELLRFLLHSHVHQCCMLAHRRPRLHQRVSLHVMGMFTAIESFPPAGSSKLSVLPATSHVQTTTWSAPTSWPPMLADVGSKLPRQPCRGSVEGDLGWVVWAVRSSRSLTAAPLGFYFGGAGRLRARGSRSGSGRGGCRRERGASSDKLGLTLTTACRHTGCLWDCARAGDGILFVKLNAVRDDKGGADGTKTALYRGFMWRWRRRIHGVCIFPVPAPLFACILGKNLRKIALVVVTPDHPDDTSAAL
jgi:hypothetical protein